MIGEVWMNDVSCHLRCPAQPLKTGPAKTGKETIKDMKCAPMP